MIRPRAHRAEQAKSCVTVGRVSGLRRRVGKLVTLARVRKGVTLQDESQRANSDQKDGLGVLVRGVK